MAKYDAALIDEDGIVQNIIVLDDDLPHPDFGNLMLVRKVGCIGHQWDGNKFIDLNPPVPIASQEMPPAPKPPIVSDKKELLSYLKTIAEQMKYDGIDNLDEDVEVRTKHIKACAKLEKEIKAKIENEEIIDSIEIESYSWPKLIKE